MRCAKSATRPLELAATRMTACPKCHYRRRPRDENVHPGICPSCGIAYAKYLPATVIPEESSEGVEVCGDDVPALPRRLLNTLTYVPEKTDEVAFWGRVALLAVLVVWGCSFMLAGIDWEKIGGSFLHNVNLAFHEFGHVLFRPLGRFMGILGGSLFQVLWPLVFVVAFSFHRHDNFAAAVCLWWCGQNFIDVSPYIADAPHRLLPLIGGMGEEAHDWGNLLTMTDSLDSAPSLANASFGMGTLLMLVSFVWAAWLLLEQYRRMERVADHRD